MLRKLSRVYLYFLIMASIGMATWGLAGFTEYLSGINVVVPLQNPNFPPGIQFVTGS